MTRRRRRASVDGMVHLPALDGIRAVAVIAVLAFHGGIAAVSGGFLGVDAFFVLSGYLITALLLSEWARTDGRIDLAAFWGRRTRRLLPALLLVVAVVAVVGQDLLPPEEARQLRGDGLAALFYVANWRMILGGGDYFAQTAAPSPLQHTWSLGIEEQFYLLWPLVLCALLWRRRDRAALRWLLVVCAVGVAASTLALAATYVPEAPGRAYYGTDTRGGAILVGAGLAVLLQLRGGRHVGPPRRWPQSLLGAAAALAMLALGWSATRVSGTDTALFRGGMLALSLATAVVIAHVVLVPTGWSARLLSLPPFPALGRISYGVYLWHWPVFIAANADRTGLAGLELFAVRCLLTLALAYLSYVLVERPVQLRLRFRRAASAVAGAGTAVAAGVAVVTVSAAAVPALPVQAADASVEGAVEEFLEGSGAVPGRSGRRTAPRPAHEKGRDEAAEPHTRSPGEPVVVSVLGDSVAWTLANYLPSHPDVDVRDRTLMGCGVTRARPFRYFDRLYPRMHPTCLAWPRLWRASIVADDPDVALILVGRWETMDRMLDGQWTHVGEPAFDAHLRAALGRAIRIAGSHGARVVLATEPYNRRGERLDGSLFPEDQPERVTAWNALLRDVAASHRGVRVIELGERISPDGEFSWTAGGYQIRSDGLHLTPSGVQGWIAPWLFPQLVAAVPEAPRRVRPGDRRGRTGG
jgi:peptidoglycan/LPS O-acetylase OafA/YrhL